MTTPALGPDPARAVGRVQAGDGVSPSAGAADRGTEPFDWLDPDHMDWRFGFLTANVWLVFLAFPLLTIIGTEDLATSRKLVGVAGVVVFGVVHMAAYRHIIGGHRSWRHSAAWLGALVLVAIGIGVIAGWAALGVTPFLVTFALFNFRWAIGLALVAVIQVVVIVAPLIGGVLDDLWFFPLIVVAVAGGAGFSRAFEERLGERAQYETRLAVGDERNRVARDVHDVLGHSLTAVVLKVQVVDRMLERLDPADPSQQVLVADARRELDELMAVSRGALDQVRMTVVGLRAADLGDELEAARSVLADAGVELTVVGEVDDVGAGWRPLVAAVVREAVTNVVRHASADRCEVTLGGGGAASGPPCRSQAGGSRAAEVREVLVRVTDDGVGLADRAPGNGLAGLRERVESAGAILHVGPGDDGRGTAIEVATAEREAPALGDGSAAGGAS